MLETPRFIQGIYSFKGAGLTHPISLDPPATFLVPVESRCQLTYLRAGNSSSELIYLLVERDGTPMRYFPVGAKSAIHIALAVTEDLEPDTLLEILIAAPEGTEGEAIIDAGFMEF